MWQLIGEGPLTTGGAPPMAQPAQWIIRLCTCDVCVCTAVEASSNAVSQPGRARRLAHKSLVLSTIGVAVGALTVTSVVIYYVTVDLSHSHAVDSSSSSSSSHNFTATTRPAIVTDLTSAVTATVSQ